MTRDEAANIIPARFTPPEPTRLERLLDLQDRIADEIALERRREAEAAAATRRRRKLVAECGTDSGYYRHIRGTKTTPPSEPCDPCLAAHAHAFAVRAAAKKPLRWKRRNGILVTGRAAS